MSPNPNAVFDELCFRKGDVIKVYGGKDVDGFYRGELAGRVGLVPGNMVADWAHAADQRAAAAGLRHLQLKSTDCYESAGGRGFSNSRRRSSVGVDGPWAPVNSSDPALSTRPTHNELRQCCSPGPSAHPLPMDNVPLNMSARLRRMQQFQRKSHSLDCGDDFPMMHGAAPPPPVISVPSARPHRLPLDPPEYGYEGSAEQGYPHSARDYAMREPRNVRRAGYERNRMLIGEPAPAPSYYSQQRSYGSHTGLPGEFAEPLSPYDSAYSRYPPPPLPMAARPPPAPVPYAVAQEPSVQAPYAYKPSSPRPVPPRFGSMGRTVSLDYQAQLPAHASGGNEQPQPQPMVKRQRRAVALYDYQPQAGQSPNVDAERELAFRAGDVITVAGQMDQDGFYWGELNGRHGLVPSNYVELLPGAALPRVPRAAAVRLTQQQETSRSELDLPAAADATPQQYADGMAQNGSAGTLGAQQRAASVGSHRVTFADGASPPSARNAAARNGMKKLVKQASVASAMRAAGANAEKKRAIQQSGARPAGGAAGGASKKSSSVPRKSSATAKSQKKK